jgi:hypothetical protein
MFEFYARSFGRVNQPMVFALKKGIEAILDDSLEWSNDYTRFYRFLKIDPPSPEELEQLFTEIVNTE